MSERARNEPVLPPGMADKLDELFAFANRSDTPGFTVGIARGGRTLYRKGFGMASLEHATKNVPTTRMRIGSTTKHFACLCALLLAEEGKLDIDASVRAYMPELPVLLGEPTLRQLMTHSGGHHCYLDLAFLADGMAVKPIGSAIETQVRQQGVNFAPGERMMYNNGGYHVLSRVIERVSGMPLRTFMRERLFEPLGMSDTDLVPSDFEIGAGMATLHMPMPDGSYRRGIFPSEEVLGEGGITSTVDDMLKWVAHLRNPRLFGSARTWREMFKPTTLKNGFVIDYSLGLMRYTHRGVETICHAGGVMGGGGQMLTAPAKELDIVVLNNTGGIDPAELTFKILSLLLQDEGLLDATPTVHAKTYELLLGRKFHSSERGLFLAFEDKDGALCVSAFNGPAVPLVDMGDVLMLEFHKFAVGPFEFDKSQCASQVELPLTLRVLDAGTPVHLECVDPVIDLQASMDCLVGTYACPDMAAKAKVVRQGEELRLKLQGEYGRNELVLEPLARGVYSFKASRSDVSAVGIVETHHVDGQVRALLLSTTRSTRIRLTRVPESASVA